MSKGKSKQFNVDTSKNCHIMFTEQNIIELAEKCLQSIIQSNGAATSELEMTHYSKLAFDQTKVFVKYYEENIKA